MTNQRLKRVFCNKWAVLFVLCALTSSVYSTAIQQISLDQGLAGSGVWGIETDDDGFVWILTSAGLFRYDGKQVKSFSAEHPLSRALGSYTTKHPDGSIWVATYEEGVWKLLPDQQSAELIIPYHKSEEYNDFAPNAMIWLNEHELLLGLFEHALIYDTKTGSLELVFELPTKNIDGHLFRSFYKLEDTVLMGTSAGMFALDVETKQSFKVHHTDNEGLLDEDNVKAFIRHQERLLVATVRGLYQYPIDFLDNHNRLKPYLTPAELIVEEINIWGFLLQNDQVLMATASGLKQLSNKNEIRDLVKLSSTPFYVSNENMTKIHQGKGELLWLGSLSDGVFIWNPKTRGFSNIAAEQGLLSNTVWSISADSNNQLLWVGTDKGLNRVDLATGKVQSAMQNKASVFANSIIEEVMPHSNGLVYVFASDGVYWYNPTTNDSQKLQYKNATPEIQNHYAWGAEMAVDGSMWWFSEYGAFRYQPNTKELERLEWLSNYSRLAWDCAAFNGPPPQLFISCPNVLLVVDTEQSTVETVTDFQQLEGFDKTSVFLTSSMVTDENNLWWFAVGPHGLVAIDPENFSVKQHLLPGKELPITRYSSIAKNSVAGVFWVGTSQGLIRINPNTLQISQYTVHDGTFTNDFLDSESISLDDGRLVFASTKGLVFINSERFQQEPDEQIEVYLTGVHTLSSGGNGVEILAAIKNEFEHDETGLSFAFSTLNFNKTKNIRYSFELKGPQNISFPPQKNNSITFPQLKSGNYVLTTTATNALNGIKSNPLQTAFKIKHHWWLTPVAKAIYFAAIGLLLLLWSFSRRKQQLILEKAHAKSLKSERRLSLALQGSNSQVWEWQASNNHIDQRRIIDLLGFDGEPQQAPLDHHMSFIHPEDQAVFKQTWDRFVSLREAPFKLTYRMKNAKGDWLWFSDIASGQFEQGLLKQATGTYTNITEQHAQESKAALFGEVFQQANDAVLILNEKWQIKTANHAFNKIFKQHTSDVKGLDAKTFLHNIGAQIDLDETQKQVSLNGHHTEEALVTVEQEQLPVLISYSFVKGLGGESQYLITFINIKALKEAEQALQKMAQFDHLTGLSNRRSFMSVIHNLCNDPYQENNKVLMFIDLDRFKQVNDSLGHNRGDELLIAVSSRIKQIAAPGDLLGRYGGDEFVLLLEAKNRTKEQIKAIANQLIEVISQPVNLGVAKVSVTPSIGIACFPKDGLTAFDLLQAADVAMYNAKANGRSNYQFFTEKMKQHAQEKLELEHQIKRDYENDKFVNFYQPIINRSKNKISSLELLMRWNKEGSILLPKDFIDEAEDIGLLGTMTLKAFKRGLEDLKHWHQFDPDLSININVSARHFEESGFVNDFKAVIDDVGVKADKVNIELTESILLKNKEAALSTVKKLRDLGFKLYLDDFGTGYSSLSYIHALSLDGVKIDKSFISRLGSDDKTLAITEGITQLCVKLGLVVVAEGIETQQQSEQLFNMGAQVQQGFWYAKPLSFSQIEQYITSKESIIPQQ